MVRNAMCLSERKVDDEEKLEGTSTSSQEEAPAPPKMKDMTSPPHLTFPLRSSPRPHPSHFQTAPASTGDTIFDSPTEITPDSSPAPPPDAQTSQVTPPRSQIRRKSTCELQENRDYHPQGGPDYIRILTKYGMLKEVNNSRVICRFVRAGGVSERRPQVIKIENISPQANQEFLAPVVIGNGEKKQGIPHQIKVY
jgi:hypothetical protein